MYSVHSMRVQSTVNCKYIVKKNVILYEKHDQCNVIFLLSTTSKYERIEAWFDA